jgi:hypothetical protein
MASPLTMQAYVWNLPRPEAGLTLRLRTVILHEIGHLVSYRVRPDVHAWPVWLQEGLADVGTFRSLNKPEAAAFHADQVGRWRGAEAVGNLPPLQDLLTRYAGADLHGWYTSAYLFTSRVAGPEALLPSLLDRLEGERLQPHGALTALEILESRARPIWRALRDEAMIGPAPPQVHSGHLDAADGDWKISSAAGSGARILLPSIPSPSEGSLEASFSWEAGGGRQADVYLAYSAGRDSAQFLKLAVLPKRVVLFRFYDERWEEWGRVQYPEGLEEGPTAWHSIRLDWSFRERTLRATIDANRAAKFFLKSHIPSEGTSIALGSFDSVVHFKDVNVR